MYICADGCRPSVHILSITAKLTQLIFLGNFTCKNMVYHRNEKVQVPFSGRRVTSAYHVCVRLVDSSTGEVHYDNFRDIVVADGSSVADNFVHSLLQCYIRGLCLGKPLRLELDAQRVCDLVPDIFSHSYVSK